MGKVIGDAVVTMYIWLGIILLTAIVIIAMFIRYKKRKNNDDKAKAQSRIVIYLLVGLFVLVLSPLLIGTLL